MTSDGDIAVVPLRTAPPDERPRLVRAITGLQLAPGQEEFVGNPPAMVDAALADPQRHPFAIVTAAGVVGMGVLHVDGAADVGWPDPSEVVLLRGFLIDRGLQGRGYGTSATERAFHAAAHLVGRLGLPARGVVLGVNERNHSGQRAYARAGFADTGRRFLGGSGAQIIMLRAFEHTACGLPAQVGRG
ncbi:GNAT family N-acetyltransferase [Specibacter cremeus]|uniref:GNAT family N-acetyltransferase n=1 Tax=Specibacter cremeus TaxID=1629051 RepID=UPI000F7964B8|nr:GNAT family N-acetyltransferase [Specibacter cremeus]